MMKLFNNIGPGTLVAAAFIGPGTVTVCTLAGVNYDYRLLWAMLVSIFATMVLQEMAARVGLVTGKGLAENVKQQLHSPWLRFAAIVLILSAILVGNAAYEAGNISGGVLGLQTIFDEHSISIGSFEINTLSLVVGIIAFALLFIGNYKLIERSLVALVVLMSVSFLLTAFITSPNVMEVIKGIFLPSVPEESWITIIALVGTTVVPYNLFLHASLVREKWEGAEDLKAARRDTYISILLGGLVSMAIIVCAAAIQKGDVKNASDLALGLEPLYGSFAKHFLSIGLFAAGITSAITAPLAAAYVAQGSFGWTKELKSIKFRAVWMFILFLGIILSSLGWKPIEIIKFAQVANGLLLPIIAFFLLWVVNRVHLLGSYRNTRLQNIIGSLILITSLLLGIRSLEKVFDFSLF